MTTARQKRVNGFPCHSIEILFSPISRGAMMVCVIKQRRQQICGRLRELSDADSALRVGGGKRSPWMKSSPHPPHSSRFGLTDKAWVQEPSNEVESKGR